MLNIIDHLAMDRITHLINRGADLIERDPQSALGYFLIREAKSFAAACDSAESFLVVGRL